MKVTTKTRIITAVAVVLTVAVGTLVIASSWVIHRESRKRMVIINITESMVNLNTRALDYLLGPSSKKLSALSSAQDQVDRDMARVTAEITGPGRTVLVGEMIAINMQAKAALFELKTSLARPAGEADSLTPVEKQVLLEISVDSSEMLEAANS